AAKVYVGGDVVNWQGKEYKARWWTQGDRPGSSDVWENLNKVDQQEWNIETVYHGGDTAIWQGKSWKAKWWTKGEQPGSSSVWEMVK
ncbi:TPA: carbohydrate-binding protein, partial [Serratia odorifera]